MSEEIYVVLRVTNDTVETIGPAGSTFSSFDDADSFAKSLRDRFTFQSFIVCAGVTAYETRMTASVKALGIEKSAAASKRKSDRQRTVAATATASDDNVLRISAHKATAK